MGKIASDAGERAGISESPQDICERTFSFALRIIALSRTLDERPGTSWTLARQLLRSGTSVGANIEEGQAAHSRADFIAKYTISLKEARETNYWLRLLAESGLIESSRLTLLLDESSQLAKIIAASIKTAKKSQT